MLDLSITNENNIYKVSYKTDNKSEAYNIFNILKNANIENIENETYELNKEYKNVLKDRYLNLKAKENENNNSKKEDIIGDSEYDINTNRYIYKNNKNINKDIKDKEQNNINKNNASNNVIDYNICPLKPFQNSSWAVVSTVYLKTFFKVDRLPSGYKEAILKEWERRGNDKNILLSNANNESVNFNKKNELANLEEIELKKAEINKKIEAIKRGRDLFSLSDDELKKIAEIDIFDDTAKHVLEGREFNRIRDEEEKKENEILKAYKEDGIIQFGDEESKLDINKKEDPLTQNDKGWDTELDDSPPLAKEDTDGNKYMFVDEEESGFYFDENYL